MTISLDYTFMLADAVSGGVGVADFGGFPLPTVEELLATADAAMYAAKRERRREAG